MTTIEKTQQALDETFALIVIETERLQELRFEHDGSPRSTRAIEDCEDQLCCLTTEKEDLAYRLGKLQRRL